MDFIDKILVRARRINPLKQYPEIQGMPIDFQGENASKLIMDKIEGNSPQMIARLGSDELRIILEYINSKKGISKYFEYLSGKIDNYNFSETSIYKAKVNNGIFPSNKNILSKFSELMLACLPNVDVLGSWLKKEFYLKNYLNNCSIVRLKDLEPYYHKIPWSKALEGKRVLVIHPFANTIENQFKKRELLFENKDILPAFNLQTIKAVQSMTTEKPPFKDWFEALQFMKNEINKKDFDVAIIGCGAYGFPLASYVKDIGKKAVHLGGATQILFGIKGQRWENLDFFRNLFNDHWVRPSQEEFPDKYYTIENGCYW